MFAYFLISLIAAVTYAVWFRTKFGTSAQVAAITSTPIPVTAAVALAGPMWAVGFLAVAVTIVASGVAARSLNSPR